MIVAIGDNRARKRVFEALRAARCTFVNAIHPDASVSANCTLGTGITVLAGAVVSVNSTVGDGAIVDVGTTIAHDARFGRFAHAAVATVGASATVGEGAFLAMHTVVAPDLEIGAWSRCLMGAVVTRSVPEFATVAGNPARKVPGMAR